MGKMRDEDFFFPPFYKPKMVIKILDKCCTTILEIMEYRIHPKKKRVQSKRRLTGIGAINHILVRGINGSPCSFRFILQTFEWSQMLCPSSIWFWCLVRKHCRSNLVLKGQFPRKTIEEQDGKDRHRHVRFLKQEFRIKKGTGTLYTNSHYSVQTNMITTFLGF